MKKKLVFSADHAGWELKEKIMKWAISHGYKVVDLGTFTNEKPASYALQGLMLGKRIKDTYETELGIAICGTGLGISYAVNRIKGVRGARVCTIEDGMLAKKHNNANILCFGGRQQSLNQAINIFTAFEQTNFEGGRHLIRIGELNDI